MGTMDALFDGSDAHMLGGLLPLDNNAPEKRCCAACGHKGSDADSSNTESYCSGCMETVPYPAEDVCPECGATNCMMLACPECGGEYFLVEDGDGILKPPEGA